MDSGSLSPSFSSYWASEFRQFRNKLFLPYANISNLSDSDSRNLENHSHHLFDLAFLYWCASALQAVISFNIFIVRYTCKLRPYILPKVTVNEILWSIFLESEKSTSVPKQIQPYRKHIKRNPSPNSTHYRKYQYFFIN